MRSPEVSNASRILIQRLNWIHCRLHSRIWSRALTQESRHWSRNLRSYGPRVMRCVNRLRGCWKCTRTTYRTTRAYNPPHGKWHDPIKIDTGPRESVGPACRQPKPSRVRNRAGFGLCGADSRDVRAAMEAIA